MHTKNDGDSDWRIEWENYRHGYVIHLSGFVTFFLVTMGIFFSERKNIPRTREELCHVKNIYISEAYLSA